MLRLKILTVFITILTCGEFALANSEDSKAAIDTLLDQFHQAASEANEEGYFRLFAPEGIFIGTDATERWTVSEFRAYAHPHFSKGKGWTYISKSRHIDVIPGNQVAWFDELLENKSYGTCRGTGVLRLIAGSWKISQYHLTIPIPNELADQVVGMIRGLARNSPETGKQVKK